MRGISRRVLAQDLAATISLAACKDLGRWWSDCEAEFEAASDRDSRFAAAEPAVSLCASCTVQVDCASLAELTGYSGLAAGTAFRNGHRRALSGKER